MIQVQYHKATAIKDVKKTGSSSILKGKVNIPSDIHQSQFVPRERGNVISQIPRTDVDDLREGGQVEQTTGCLKQVSLEKVATVEDNIIHVGPKPISLSGSKSKGGEISNGLESINGLLGQKRPRSPDMITDIVSLNEGLGNRTRSGNLKRAARQSHCHYCPLVVSPRPSHLTTTVACRLHKQDSQ
ncbi:hypothetical protein ACFE04_028288 [Oxalis oulophora]